MADAVGGLLRGFNSGLASGLDFYKTIQAEGRAKRQEQYMLNRDAIADERYDEERAYRIKQDEAAAARDERDFEWGKEKHALEQKRLAAAAAATAEYRSQQLRLSQANYNLRVLNRQDKLNAASTEKWGKELEDAAVRGKEAFAQDPELFMDLYSSDYRVKIATNKQIARANGLDLDDDTAASLHVIERPEGFVVAKRGKDEQGNDAWLPFDADPEKDGQQAMVMPKSVFAQTFGGTEGTQAVAKVEALKGAQGEVAALANQQYAQDNADVLAKTAEQEQRLAGAQAELAELEQTDAKIYIPPTTTREKLLSSGGSELAVKLREREARKAELRAQIEQSQGYVGGMLGRQEQAKGSARATLASGLDAVGKTAQGLKPEEVPTALSNTVEQLRMGNKPSAEQLGKTPDAALDVGMKETGTMMATIKGMVAMARPSDDDKVVANEAKMISSVAAAAERNGGLKQWLATPNAQAMTMQIAAEMHERGIDYGAGYLAKVASMQRDGASVEAGLDALQSKVVQSLNAKDREPIALLASEIIGERTDDPEVAIMYAIEEYRKGVRPKTLSAAQ